MVFEIGRQIRERDRIVRSLFVIQRPLLLCSLDYAEIVSDAIQLSRRPGRDEAGSRDGKQQKAHPKDNHDDEHFIPGQS